MAVYAIGDVQGCFDALRALLDKLRYDPAADTLWFTGDLVNRGPQSLEVLRLLASLPKLHTVLGNHDLHLLAVASGLPVRKNDTFDDVLNAPDRDALLDWLRTRPLLVHDEQLGYTLVHAGLLPQWDLATARGLAAEAEHAIAGSAHSALFAHMYGDTPDQWRDDLIGWGRLRVIINAFTRLRYCDAQGRMNLHAKGRPGTQPPHLLPWFEVPGRKTRSARLVFGHWSTLGVCAHDGVVALDSGCLWGGSLTAARLDMDTPTFTAVPCAQRMAPLSG